MTLHDLRRAHARFSEGDYPDCVFRAQLSVENACKALLGYLGVEHGPTHFPSVLLGKILSEKHALKRLDFSREQIGLLLAIASKASALEAHGAMPRYGWETSERIIVPSEVYKKEVAENVLNLAVKTIDSIAKFFEPFSLPAEMKRILQQLPEPTVHNIHIRWIEKG